MSGFLSKVAVISAVLFGVMRSLPANAEGALVWGDCGVLGTAANFKTQQAAIASAMQMCRDNGGRNCRVVVTYERGWCVATATDYVDSSPNACNGQSSWGRHRTDSLAQRLALDSCRESGGRRCEPRGANCDGPPPQPIDR
jgi:hypothetical protein